VVVDCYLAFFSSPRESSACSQHVSGDGGNRRSGRARASGFKSKDQRAWVDTVSHMGIDSISLTYFSSQPSSARSRCVSGDGKELGGQGG
jgi:hypothetical protein